jgi:non-heme chloroperoxidase
MKRYAQDVVEFVVHLDLQNAVHIGHSTGGGEVARYAARAENGRIAKAALLGAVPPIMLQTAANPDGFNRDDADVKHGMINDWRRQSMMGGAQAHYDCIGAFSETDFSDDLKSLTIPVLVLHGEDDQIVPIANSA